MSTKSADTEQALAELVETFGLVLEESGLPRAAGRMLAWLLVSDPPEQSAEDLGRALSASAGGVSMAARLLVSAGFVERVGKAGDRKSYFRIVPGAWTKVMGSEQARTTRVRELTQQGLELLAAEDPSRSARLAEMNHFYRFLEHEIPALLRRYNDESETGYDKN